MRNVSAKARATPSVWKARLSASTPPCTWPRATASSAVFFNRSLVDRTKAVTGPRTSSEQDSPEVGARGHHHERDQRRQPGHACGCDRSGRKDLQLEEPDALVDHGQPQGLVGGEVPTNPLAAMPQPGLDGGEGHAAQAR